MTYKLFRQQVTEYDDLIAAGREKLCRWHIEDALASFDAALRLCPESGTAHYLRGEAVFLQRRLDEALKCHCMAFSRGFDRDIAVRGVAKGRDPDKTMVRDAMSGEVRYCFDDENPEEVARKMGSWQVRRLPVLNRDKRLVGIVSLGDLVIGGSEEPAKEALKEISQP